MTISFILPVLNEAGGIAQRLQDLRARYADAELIVVDGGSIDATVALAEPLCDHLLQVAPGRAGQMNAGAACATGRYLLFLHADTRPGIDAADLATLLAPAPAWGFCRVRLSGDEYWARSISYCMNLRSRLTRVATGDQMLWLRADVFHASGGFDPIPLMEDVAYCKRLRRLAPPVVVPVPVTTSSRRWREGGVVATVLLMWRLRLAYFLGVSPARLHRSYYGS